LIFSPSLFMFLLSFSIYSFSIFSPHSFTSSSFFLLSSFPSPLYILSPYHIHILLLFFLWFSPSLCFILLLKGKAIPVTGREGLWGCETSRLPHFLDNRLTDGDKVVSLTRRPPFTPRKIPGTHFC
jgi:hypothetical protein